MTRQIDLQLTGMQVNGGQRLQVEVGFDEKLAGMLLIDIVYPRFQPRPVRRGGVEMIIQLDITIIQALVATVNCRG